VTCPSQLHDPVDRSARGAGGQLGQGIVEYGLILGLSAVVAIVVLVFFSGTVSAALELIGRAIDEATRGS
jgi:Flp pilus assembly pilin Flp